GIRSTQEECVQHASTSGLQRSASRASSGRRIRIGIRNDLLILALDGKGHLALNPKPAFGFTSAANPVLLPKAKPRAMSEHVVVPSIGSREVAWAQRSGIGHCEDALKVLDFDDSSVNVH